MEKNNKESTVIDNSSNMTKTPRYNVISLRISEEERRHLETLVVGRKKSISSVMREALTFYSSNCEHV